MEEPKMSQKQSSFETPTEWYFSRLSRILTRPDERSLPTGTGPRLKILGSPAGPQLLEHLEAFPETLQGGLAGLEGSERARCHGWRKPHGPKTKTTKLTLRTVGAQSHRMDARKLEALKETRQTSQPGGFMWVQYSSNSRLHLGFRTEK